jgi:hypothetical protein
VLGPVGTDRNRLDGHFRLDTAIETVEDSYQPVKGEAVKMNITDTQKPVGFHADQSFGLSLRRLSRSLIKSISC